MHFKKIQFKKGIENKTHETVQEKNKQRPPFNEKYKTTGNTEFMHESSSSEYSDITFHNV